MFEGQAAEALELYASTFENAEVVDIRRYGEDAPGTVEHAVLRVGERAARRGGRSGRLTARTRPGWDNPQAPRRGRGHR